MFSTVRALPLILLAIITLLATPFVMAADVVRAVRVSQDTAHTWVALELSSPVKFSYLSLDNPHRLVVDLRNTLLKTDLGSASLQGSPVAALRSGIRNGTDLRLVFDLNRSAAAKLSWQDNHLIVELPNGNSATAPVANRAPAPAGPRVAAATPATTPTAVMNSAGGNRDVVVVIDAGHGGKDPGAIGPGKLQEKTVVLAIARELAVLFERERGYKAVLTRNDDRFLPLQERRNFARRAQADLFISVHADAFTNPKARGGSLYALSTRGATSTMAAFLATSENNADAIGGVSVKGKDDSLIKVLTDLSMTASLDASMRIGSKVLDSMAGLTHLHSRRVEQAGFMVLKSPDTPSILVETGFISNPEEARKLATRSYQRQMARAIFDGVNRHFSVVPPPGTYLAAVKRGLGTGRAEYTIARGDTLSGIAQRYGVSVASLQAHNNLSSQGHIRIGQTLKIPGGS